MVRVAVNSEVTIELVVSTIDSNLNIGLLNNYYYIILDVSSKCELVSSACNSCIYSCLKLLCRVDKATYNSILTVLNSILMYVITVNASGNWCTSMKGKRMSAKESVALQGQYTWGEDTREATGTVSCGNG